MIPKDLIDTPDKMNVMVANFRTLKDHAGWLLLKEIVEANIKVLEDQILNGINVEGIVETKELIDRKRDKLKAYREVINTPDEWIAKLETVETKQVEDDPFHTLESLRKEKKK